MHHRPHRVKDDVKSCSEEAREESVEHKPAEREQSGGDARETGTEVRQQRKA